jgi:hypothetical protein
MYEYYGVVIFQPWQMTAAGRGTIHFTACALVQLEHLFWPSWL